MLTHYLCIWAVKYLVDTNEPKISITIYKVLKDRPPIYMGWGEDMDCTNKTVNETEFILFLPLLKFKKPS